MNLGEKIKVIYECLNELEQNDRKRVLASVNALFEIYGTEAQEKKSFDSGVIEYRNGELREQAISARDYFNNKNPENRGELLAIAARYLEISQNKEVLIKDDFATVLKEARRNFDSSNFSRDMRNAVNNAKLFMSGGERETYKLSFYGQEYADNMPDKEKIKLIKRPGR